MVGEVVEAPREGTLAWLDAQPTVDVLGLVLPACHRVPEGASLAPEADGMCRLVKADGARCRAPATRRYGLCLVHAGGGGIRDPVAMSRRGNEARVRLRARRSLLGIGPARVANPRQVARLRALERAEALADALVDGPLDARDLGPIERQVAAVRALDATFPLASASIELELPADGAGVASMGWESMQALAATLLGSGTGGVPEG